MATEYYTSIFVYNFTQHQKRVGINIILFTRVISKKLKIYILKPTSKLKIRNLKVTTSIIQPNVDK